MSGGLRLWWRRLLTVVWRPRTPAETVEDLVDRGKAQLHVLEPGGVLIMSGVNPSSEDEYQRMIDALQRIPKIFWATLSHQVSVDVLSPALRALLVHQMTEQLSTGQYRWFATTEVPEQMISVLCPRCRSRVQMAVVVSLADNHGHLVARAIVDPADVDLHNLSCNGSSPGS